jgi:hypothetical protein
MSLTTPGSVQKLQTALHDKAKGSPKFRFYALYDKVYREDVMAFAYECCKANRGAAGVDGQTFEDIERLKSAGPVVTRAAGETQNRIIGLICPFLPRVFLLSAHSSERWLVGAVGIENSPTLLSPEI